MSNERVTSGHLPLLRPARKYQLAALLVERGIFEHEEEARRWIMAGQVIVNEQRIDKPGTLVRADVQIRVRGRHRYASRGGYKLEAALEHFSVPVAGQVALDCGASTGGFTDCLLQHGAALIYAVEVGFGQLVGRLHQHPRVRNMERTNLGDLHPAGIDPRPTLITLDLSYLSLTQALPIAAPLLTPGGRILALFKPLFEVESAIARRTGQLEDPQLVAQGLRRVLEAGNRAGLTSLGAIKLALQPRYGVFEYFLYFAFDINCAPWPYDDALLLRIVEDPGIGNPEIYDER